MALTEEQIERQKKRLRKWQLKNRLTTRALRQRDYRERHPEQPRKERKQRWALKEEVLTYYGGGILACVSCGFNDIRALSIDHMHGIFGKQKEGKFKHGASLYQWLKKNQYPVGYQTLCMNCQWIKRVINKEYN